MHVRGRRLGQASDDTLYAMASAPDYWLAWYTAKSLALVGAVGVIGYLLGRASR